MMSYYRGSFDTVCLFAHLNNQRCSRCRLSQGLCQFTVVPGGADVTTKASTFHSLLSDCRAGGKLRCQPSGPNMNAGFSGRESVGVFSRYISYLSYPLETSLFRDWVRVRKPHMFLSLSLPWKLLAYSLSLAYLMSCLRLVLGSFGAPYVGASLRVYRAVVPFEPDSGELQISPPSI